jgi:hypothetical protein
VNKYSSIVLWLGLIIIVLNLAKNWTVIRDIIYAGMNPVKPGKQSTSPGSTSNPPGMGGAGRHGGA